MNDDKTAGLQKATTGYIGLTELYCWGTNSNKSSVAPVFLSTAVNVLPSSLSVTKCSIKRKAFFTTSAYEAASVLSLSRLSLSIDFSGSSS